MTTVVLDSFADVVDDTYDGSLDAVEEPLDPFEQSTFVSRALYAVHAAPARALLSSAPTPTVVVPYVPGIGQGDVSDRVYAVKRAYARSRGAHRLTLLMRKPLEVRRTWGKQFSDELGQRTYDRRLHTRLAPFYDSLALSLLRTPVEPRPSPRDAIIAREIGWHNALYNRRWKVPYSQLRPSQLYRAELITRADCSGSVAGGCAWAGILPAVDWRYTNTWIQVAFGRPVAGIRDARPGDAIYYGSPSHVALYLGDGLVWSFGSYPAKILRHDYRHDRHSIRRFVPLPAVPV